MGRWLKDKFQIFFFIILDSVPTLSPTDTSRPPTVSSSMKAGATSTVTSVPDTTTPSSGCDLSFQEIFFVWFRDVACPRVTIVNKPDRTWGVLSGKITKFKSWLPTYQRPILWPIRETVTSLFCNKNRQKNLL